MGVALKLQCYRITKLFTEWAEHNVVGVVLVKWLPRRKGKNGGLCYSRLLEFFHLL